MTQFGEDGFVQGVQRLFPIDGEGADALLVFY
jgi:hypothetical protein